MHRHSNAPHHLPSPEILIARAAAALRSLIAGESGEEDILAAELNYAVVSATYQRGEPYRPTDRRSR
ncbi:MAG TPA: hypothetical protein VMU89_09400 [Thermomicrobiaceae bacterium]|nr:hypothetical protein [Thermomicrobiaceae bacterium]